MHAVAFFCLLLLQISSHGAFIKDEREAQRPGFDAQMEEAGPAPEGRLQVNRSAPPATDVLQLQFSFLTSNPCWYLFQENLVSR